MRKQERAYDKLRYPGAHDRQQLTEAIRRYWTHYYQEYQRLHPGFSQEIGQKVEHIVTESTKYDTLEEKRNRDYIGQLVDAAYRGDEAALRAALQQRPDSIDYDDAAHALVERSLLQAAQVVLNIAYDLEEEDEPRDQWIREQMQSIAETIASD